METVFSRMTRFFTLAVTAMSTLKSSPVVGQCPGASAALRPDGVFWNLRVEFGPGSLEQLQANQTWQRVIPGSYTNPTGFYDEGGFVWSYGTDVCAGVARFRLQIPTIDGGGFCVREYFVEWPSRNGNCASSDLSQLANLSACSLSSATTASIRTPILRFIPNDPGNPNDDRLELRSPIIRSGRQVVPIFHGFAEGPSAAWIMPLARCLQQRFPNADVLVVDSSSAMNPEDLPGIAEACAVAEMTLPQAERYISGGCDVIDAYLMAKKLSDAREATEQVAADINAQLCRDVAPGQRIDMPLIVGRGYGGLAAARMLPRIYSKTDIGALALIDTPHRLNEGLFQPDASNEIAFANLARRVVNLHNSDRTALGRGSPMARSSLPSTVDIRSRFSASDLLATQTTASDYLIKNLAGWLCSPEGEFRTRNSPVVPGESTSLVEVGTTFTFESSVGNWYPEPSFDELQRHAIVQRARTGPYIDLTEQAKAFTNVLVPQVPGLVTVRAPDSDRAGFSLGDVTLTGSAGYISFEYRFCGDCSAPSNGSFQPQYASFWVNERLAWSTNVDSAPGEWQTAIVPVHRAAGGTARIAIAVSRQQNGQNATITLQNIRLVDASAGDVFFRCSPADIADDQGNPLPPAPGVNNSGINEGDYNAFFAADGFFNQAALATSAVGMFCDIADDQGTAFPPFGIGGGSGAANTGVNEGDYNCFFNNLFLPCV